MLHICCLLSLTTTYKIAHWEHGVELISHGVVLQGHEEGVQHDAYGDAQIQERIHNH